MATVLLVRHGRTTANAEGVLAGRTPGIGLDDVGRAQVGRTAARLAEVPLAGIVSSPLQRCRETAQALLDARDDDPGLSLDDGIVECDYGQWQGRRLSELAGEDLWSVVQRQPSAATFPGGESLRAMSTRAVAAVRENDAVFEAEHGPSAVWAAVSHGDLIKAVLADALGAHLDAFQRISVGPASVSIVRYGTDRPTVTSLNSDAGDLSWLATATTPPSDAAVGGGAGHST